MTLDLVWFRQHLTTEIADFERCCDSLGCDFSDVLSLVEIAEAAAGVIQKSIDEEGREWVSLVPAGQQRLWRALSVLGRSPDASGSELPVSGRLVAREGQTP